MQLIHRTGLGFLAMCLATTLALAQGTPATSEAEAGEHAEITEPYVYAKMKTSEGDVYLELNNAKAPITVKNFVTYAKDKAYDGTIFHRVIDGFMIQGGGFEDDMTKRRARDPIENEWKNGLSNARGTIAMARLGGQADSATNQFFINVNDNNFLDTPRDGAGYAVFGKVVKGMDVVDAIKAVATTVFKGMRDVPIEPVFIEEVTVLTPEQAAEAGLGRAADTNADTDEGAVDD